MKFFWKLYFSLMILLCSCFSIGSYILIQGSFNNSLKREMNTAYQENSSTARLWSKKYRRQFLSLLFLTHLQGGQVLRVSTRCGTCQYIVG